MLAMTVSDSRAPSTATPSAEPIMQMLQGYQVSGILRSGIELGVFDRLADGATAAGEVASAVGADERGMRILLDALSALGLVQADGGTYRLTPLSQTFLVSSGPTYIGALSRVFSADHLWARFMRLSEAVRQGGAVTEDHGETPQHAWWEEFAASIGAFAGVAAASMAGLLAPWATTREPLDVLDVACGNGMYGYTLAQQQPQARVWSLDWPNVLNTTRQYAQRMGVAGRVDFIAGDMFEVPLRGPYDIVLMSHVLHHFDEDRCITLLRRAAEVMRPGGRIAIQEFVATGDPMRDMAARLFSVIMLVWTRHGEAPSLPAMERMLSAAGFVTPAVHPVPEIPTSIVIAERRG
jgi:C-methyltransferase